MRISTVVAGILLLCGRDAIAGEWTVETVDGAPDLAAVWATPEGEVWVAGAKSALHHEKDGSWVAEKVPLVVDLTELGGTSASDVWVGGTGGGFAHWDGVEWTSAPSETKYAYECIAAVSRKLAAAVSAKHLVLWNGNHWDHTLRKPSFSGLRAIAAVDAKGGFVAVGDKGLVVDVAGGEAKNGTAGERGFRGVVACGGDVIAIGAGAARRDAKGRWRTLAAPPVEVRGAVAHCGKKGMARVAAIAGDEVLILDVAKNSWSRQTVKSGATLTDIASLGAGLVVTGKGGLIATLSTW